MDMEKLLSDAEDEPAGVVARSADGRLFFIPGSEADRLAIGDSTLYRAFFAARGDEPPIAEKTSLGPCQRVKIWLDTHNPNSAKWRALCIAYFNNC